MRRLPALWLGAWTGLVVAAPVALYVHSPVLLLGVGGLIANFVATRLAARRMAGLRDAPDDGQFAVALTLHREMPYGFDEGLVAFVDGWLVYSGRRCAFSVRASDVAPRVIDRKHRLEFAGDHVAVLSAEDSKDFATAFRNWRGLPAPSGEPLFPPIVPDASAYRSLAALLGTLAVGALGSLVAIWVHRSWLVAALFVAGGAALATLSYALEVRRALVRMERGQPALPPFWNRPLRLRQEDGSG